MVGFMTNHDTQLTALESKLLDIAFRDVPDEIKVILECFDQDELYDPGCYDWQHYVNEDVRALWGQLDFGQKLIAYIAASAEASGVG
jgi:hypothetical protein